MNSFSLFSDAIVQALGWTLLHAVWQGIAIAALVGTILFLLRHKSSQSRYAVGIAGLLAQVLASAGTFLVYFQTTPASSTLARSLVSSRAFVPQAAVYQATNLPWHTQALWFLQTHLDSIVVCWLVGASVLLVRLVGSWVYVQQLKSEGISLTEPHLQTVFGRIVKSLNIAKTVQLFESVRVSVPMVVGFIKPVVLLPVGLATGLTTKQIEAILAHELAHVKRYDYLINLLQSVVEVVYFFHPALWWLSARVRTEREHCCDDVAVQVCGSKIALAQALAEVAAYRQTPALAMAFASSKNVTLQRVKRVLGMGEKPAQHLTPNALVLLICLAFGVSGYAIQQDQKPKKNKTQTSTKTKRKAKLGEMPSEAELRAMVANATREAQPTVDAVLANLDDIVANAMIEAQPTVDAVMATLNDSTIVELRELSDLAVTQNPEPGLFEDLNQVRMAQYSRKIDSLQRLMQPQHEKMEAIRLEMQQHEFKVNELERKMELLDWKRNKVYQERGKLLDKRGGLLQEQDGKNNKKTEAEIEKEIAQLEEQIRNQESQIQQFNKQNTELRDQIKAARQPLEELERQIQKLEEMNEKYSAQMERYSMEMTHLVPLPPLSASPRVRARAPRPPRATTPPRPATAPRPATPPAPAKK
jgi:bla regulator protein blaR1